MGAKAVIPPKRNRKVQREYDKDLYKQRNRIERCFSKLKCFRRFATLYEKSKTASMPSSPSLTHGFTCNYMSIRPKEELWTASVVIAELLSGIDVMPTGRKQKALREAVEGMIVEDF